MNPYEKTADQLVAQFRAWERRGRGWDVYPYPVELEPPFRPFRFHQAYFADRGDAGREPSFLAGLFGARARPNRSVTEIEEDEPEAVPVEAQSLPTELHLLLSQNGESAKDTLPHLLESLNLCREPVSFELIGSSGSVSMQLACADADRQQVVRQLGVSAPGVAVLDRTGFLSDRWYALRGVPLVVDLGLSSEFMRPLSFGRGNRVDPLSRLISALASAEEGEIALVQVLFQPVRAPWAESIIQAVHDYNGKPFFATGSELAALARQKVAHPLYACRMRFAAKAYSRGRSVELVRTLLQSLGQYAGVDGTNQLIALDHDNWDLEAQEIDLVMRVAHRPGMISNHEELEAFVRLPGREAAHLPLERLRVRTKAVPAVAVGSGLCIGENAHLGQRSLVRLSDEVRRRHLYVIGASGTGKSTFLLNLILQDVEAGRGVAVLDPHGDLVDGVLGRVPHFRADDVILLDPADEQFPIGLNVLAAHSELERTLLSSDLVAIFRRLSTSWGDQMNSVFANAILAFLESTAGGTLLDLRHFLVDSKFRASFLSSVRDPEVVYYWQKEFPLLKGNPQGPILTRLDAFLRPKLIRNMVGQQDNKLDFRSIMDEGKIVLARLSHGAIGEENAYLLGALLVSKLHQTALSRQDQDAASRRDFFLYADEFQHFATPSMAQLLSGVRKYRLGLTLAHQELRQLGGRTDEVASAALTNAATRVVFRVGDSDAKMLAEGFSGFEARDLQNLGTGEAIARIERAEWDFNLSTPGVPELDEFEARAWREEVREQSREQYATPIEELIVASRVRVAEEVKEDAPAVSEHELERPMIPPSHAPPARPAQAQRPIPTMQPPASPGRGGKQHKYLQSLIKQIGEDRGFRATIEKAVLEGQGSIDVKLEREGCSVACEITVTTPTEYEVGNLAKCLEAGFKYVVLVGTNKKTLDRARSAATKVLSPELLTRLSFLSPEGLPAFLDALPGPERVETINGYRVAVEHKVQPPEQQTSRLRAVRDVIARSLRGFGEGK